jgi:hypothetical protein
LTRATKTNQPQKQTCENLRVHCFEQFFWGAGFFSRQGSPNRFYFSGWHLRVPMHQRCSGCGRGSNRAPVPHHGSEISYSKSQGRSKRCGKYMQIWVLNKIGKRFILSIVYSTGY